MEFLKFLSERYSVRRFSDKKVPEDMVEKLVEAARIAPTAHNYQPFKIYDLRGDGVNELLSKITPCNYKAPLNLVITVDSKESWKRPDGYDLKDIDAGIIGTQIMLMAEALGLGACWIADIKGKEAKELLNLSEFEEVVTIFEIGYEAENSRPGPWHTKRKAKEVVYQVKDIK